MSGQGGAGSVTLKLSIPAAEMRRLYEGSAREVVARAENGQMVRFPARVLRGEVTHAGVHGRFRLSFDADGRFTAITRL